MLDAINKRLFKSKKPHYDYLRKKWTKKNQEITENLFDKHIRRAAAGTLGGLMLMTSPGMQLPTHQTQETEQGKIAAGKSNNALLAAELKDKLPKEVRALTPEEEQVVADLVQKDLGISVKAEIDNKRLNRSYGVIGGEQHLYRYPGDTLESHARDAQDWAMYGKSGIAPGLGAWGYFANSKAEFSKEDEERERYYLAVQTFLSPGFSERVGEYRDFYKFRKMLVINPKTGQAVVAVIGDAGPAAWTGKHLGGKS